MNKIIRIEFLGHACFKLYFDDYSVVLDPYKKGYVPGLDDLNETADMVFCSHQHGDHNAVEEITINNSSVDVPFELTVIDSYHDDVKGAKRGLNKIHLFKYGDATVAHMGDIGCDLNDEQKELLSDTDVILIPVGGFYTIDADKAAEIVNAISPKHVIPMHYRGGSFGFDNIGTVDRFIQLIPETIRLSPKYSSEEGSSVFEL